MILKKTLIQLSRQTKSGSQFVINNRRFVTYHHFSHLGTTAQPYSTKLISHLTDSKFMYAKIITICPTYPNAKMTFAKVANVTILSVILPTKFTSQSHGQQILTHFRHIRKNKLSRHMFLYTIKPRKKSFLSRLENLWI